MVLSALPFYCDLHSVANPNIEAPPLGLVWLVFQNLYNALDFLHNTCNPPISHGDLQSTNILLGFHDPETETLPKVMLVDFGQGKDKRSEVGERGTSDLCHIVSELGTSSLDEYNGEGGASYDAMRNFVSGWGDNEFVEPLLADIWNMFGSTAEQTIQSLTAAEEQEICYRVLDQILEVAREGQGSGDIRQDVRRILE
jgi:serine/threonine protein kinase